MQTVENALGTNLRHSSLGPGNGCATWWANNSYAMVFTVLGHSELPAQHWLEPWLRTRSLVVKFAYLPGNSLSDGCANSAGRTLPKSASRTPSPSGTSLAIGTANGTRTPMHHHETGNPRLPAPVPQDAPFASFNVRGGQRLPFLSIFREACFQFLHFSTWHGSGSELKRPSAAELGSYLNGCATKILW
jgi:hypothetical protein